MADPPVSRALAASTFAAAGSALDRGWAGACLAYHQARAADAAGAAATLGEVGELLRDARGRALVEIVSGYVEVARGEFDRAIATVDAVAADAARDGRSPPLERFMAGHALALAHGRQGRLAQVLHHHYANLQLLEQCGSPSPLGVTLLNLSSTFTAIDDWEEALALARRAVESCRSLRNDALERRSRINVALALRFLGRLDESLALLDRLEAEPYRDPGSDFALHLNFAEALARQGNLGRAREQLDLARACAAPASDAHERSNLAWVGGLVAALAGDIPAAVEQLEIARSEVLALRKLHVPLLPRIVEVLASCHARAGDHARAFETFRQFHDAYQARLGYTTRVSYTGRQTRQAVAAIDTALAGAAPRPAAQARLAEALRRTLATSEDTDALPSWNADTIARMSAHARSLGVEPEYVGRLVENLRDAAEAPDPEHAQPVRLSVLGSFEVRVGRAPLRFGRKRPERPLALLKYLAAHATREVPETLVADALWPDLEGDAALRALAVNLHRLRQLLGGPGAIAHQGRRLRLDARQVWCDAAQFEDLLDRACAAGDEAERDLLTGRAIAIYRGDLVVDEDRERWALAARRRLRARFVGACAGRGARLASVGRWEEACASFTRGLEQEPLAEELCLGLMRGCVALGRHEAGVAAYQQLAAGLAQRGTRPPAALDRLYRDLLAAPCAARSVPNL